jgi:hypothetical protein
METVRRNSGVGRNNIISRGSEVFKRWNIPITHPVKEAFFRWTGAVGGAPSSFHTENCEIRLHSLYLPVHGTVHKVREMKSPANDSPTWSWSPWCWSGGIYTDNMDSGVDSDIAAGIFCPLPSTNAVTTIQIDTASTHLPGEFLDDSKSEQLLQVYQLLCVGEPSNGTIAQCDNTTDAAITFAIPLHPGTKMHRQ